MKVAVIIFPGTNREKDMIDALRLEFDADSVITIFHKDTVLPKGLDLVVLPGGFSFGDYLRIGAIAANSPIMQDVAKQAQGGLKIMGICNGFQILCEAGLLEGSLSRNQDDKFMCDHVHLRVENNDTIFSRNYKEKQIIEIPVANMDGNYYADEATLQKLEDNGQVLFRYCEATGDITDDSNPNGSCRNIAGITNEAGNVFGFMPHPENACLPHHDSQDGRALFASLRESL